MNLRAFMVSVNYSDILSLTLPYNRHHFDSVHIVTSKADLYNVAPIAERNGAVVHATDAFYEGNAQFAKYKALEEILDRYGRHGWICLMDADVIWPKEVHLERYLLPGYLYTPYRRIVDPIPKEVPPESEWNRYPKHNQEREFAGYSQIFWGHDPVLGSPPWHDTSWSNCSGGDSFFQMKWRDDRKVRPNFSVLHLGPVHVNWCGRTTPYLDGTVPPEREERSNKLREILMMRKKNRNFDFEKLK